MDYKKIVVAGAGVLGSQIGYQTAFKGFDVTFWLRSEGSIERAKPRVENWYKTYLADLEAHKEMIGNKEAEYARGLIEDFEQLTQEKIEELKAQAKKAYESIKYETDLAKAVKDADLVIESVSEIPDQKAEFFRNLSEVMEEKTVVVTNSSTLLPSAFAKDTGRPEKFLALHFANMIWRNNIGEVMGHDSTDPKYIEEIKEFADAIGMIPVYVKKEQPGYLLNSLLVPFLTAGQTLLANDVADFQDIDKAWKIGTGAPHGPFEILDVVGLDTAYNISMHDPRAKDPNTVQGRIAKILKDKIDEGKTGIETGEGFYKYHKQ